MIRPHKYTHFSIRKYGRKFKLRECFQWKEMDCPVVDKSRRNPLYSSHMFVNRAADWELLDALRAWYARVIYRPAALLGALPEHRTRARGALYPQKNCLLGGNALQYTRHWSTCVEIRNISSHNCNVLYQICPKRLGKKIFT